MIEEIVDELDDYLYAYLRKKILAYALKTLGLAATGFWGKVAIKIVGLVVDKLIIPAFIDLKNEGFLFLRKQELKKKLKKYMEAETSEDCVYL